MNVFSLSFGKDSMATLILAAEQGIPIDRVIYCDIQFNDEISGEHPIMAEWIPTAEQAYEICAEIVKEAEVGYENTRRTDCRNGERLGTSKIFGDGNSRKP